MNSTCQDCGMPFLDQAVDESSAKSPLEVCHLCGSSRSGPPGQMTRPLPGPPIVTAPVDDGTTLFQPSGLADGLPRSTTDVSTTDVPAAELSDERTALAEVTATAAETAPPPPPLQLGCKAWFLVLGAAPGHERLELEAARTVLGRRGADLEIEDPAMSSRHCQIDVMGTEVFARDLESKNGTFLNGHGVRYSELLPGDELRLGDTVLIFRTAEDGLSERR